MESDLVSPAALRLRKTLGGSNAELWEVLGVGSGGNCGGGGGSGSGVAEVLAGADKAFLDPDLPSHRHVWDVKVRAERNLRLAFFAQALDPYASWSLGSLTCRPLGPRLPGPGPKAPPHQAHMEAQLLGRFVAGRLEFNVATTHKPPRDTPPLLYAVQVRFDTPAPGDYAQVLVLDFGDGHLLGVPLSVATSGPSEDSSHPRWANLPLKEGDGRVSRTTSHHLVIDNSSEEDLSNHSAYFIDAPPFTYRPLTVAQASDFDRELLVTGLAEIRPKPDKLNLGESWTRATYAQRLLHLLDLEQAARATVLASNAAMSQLELGKMFSLDGEGGEVRVAAPGELLGRVLLDGVLSEDSPGGRLLTQQCDTMDVELVTGPPGVRGLGQGERRLRWECPLEAKQRDAVLFRLPKDMVNTHQLLSALEMAPAEQTDKPSKLAVQAKVVFKLQSLAFAEWRYALKHLPSAKLVFPDEEDVAAAAKTTADPGQLSDELRSQLNLKQRAVVAEALRSTGDWPLPLLVVGPWGTGKTLTLAWLSRTVLAAQPSARVLVCTQSNSAADLYLQKYFHRWVQDGLLPKPLRIYYTGRKLETVGAEGRAYATLDEEGRLRWPTAEELDAARLVVTTLGTAKHLMGQLQGRHSEEDAAFSHILIDEAAQAMEPATLVPLTVAGKRSQVILAGDPRQSGPACYSQVAKRHGLNQSLLERLWALYPPNHPRRLHLTANYRSCAGLVEYLGKHFYQQKLLACCELPGHPSLPPVALFPVRGVDRHDATSGGYHNLAEVRRVVALAAEMAGPGWWPRETWGPFSPAAIGVLCPYQDQVLRIRQQLRNHKDPRLRRVNVEHINNVQGKEYKVVIISTVRTLGTVDGTSPAGLEGGGFLSDPRLLNTALTRAQTLLAVVGDPVSLATLGHAKNLWRKILGDWGPQSPQPELWPTLQQHIKFVDSSLRSSDTASQRLFLNPFSAQFTPSSAAKAQEADADPQASANLLRVLVQRNNASLAEAWVPADVLRPFLEGVSGQISLPPQLPSPHLPAAHLPNGLTNGLQHSAVSPSLNGELSGQMNGFHNGVPAQFSQPPPQLPPGYPPGLPSELYGLGPLSLPQHPLPPPPPFHPSILPWQLQLQLLQQGCPPPPHLGPAFTPMGFTPPGAAPYGQHLFSAAAAATLHASAFGHPPVSGLSPLGHSGAPATSSGSGALRSLLDSSFPCPPGLTPPRLGGPKRKSDGGTRRSASSSPPSAGRPDDAPKAPAQPSPPPPVIDALNFPPLASPGPQRKDTGRKAQPKAKKGQTKVAKEPQPQPPVPASPKEEAVTLTET